MTDKPQLLLTDQRTPSKKWADRYRPIDAATAQAYVEEYRKAFPALPDFFKTQLGEPYDPNRHFPTGGSPTGRLSRRTIPYMGPRGGEFVVPKDHPLVSVDYGKVEARVLASYALPKHFITMHVDTSRFSESIQQVKSGITRFQKAMKEHALAISKLNDRMILLALFGDIKLDEPEPGFAYERRLAKLLKSGDRRQRKRGERLFNNWYRTRKGMNLYRGYSGK